MAKSKNHTNHNQVYKNHRNGIKRTRRPKKMSMAGMNCKFVRNQAYAKRGGEGSKEEKEERLRVQKEAQKKLEEKKTVEKAQRLKELQDEKEKEALKAASRKK
uniref:60S ribosomal protein L29 n=1 Tax=Noctiluca scintillans TaxID=2966 RepID=A0A7S0ZUY0_NOCSC